MKPPTFVRPLTDDERQALKAGLRSPEAFTLRRCQVLLQSADGKRPKAIAAAVGCCVQSVRNALRAFEAEGLACLGEKSSRPKATREIFDDSGGGGSATCSTAARATSASRPASGRSTWPPRWPTPRA
jgi:hypothetical protein